MSSLDAAGVGQLARRLDLISEEQFQDAMMEVGERAAPAESLLKVLERRGTITPLQASKLKKGDTDGYILGGYRLLYRIAAGSFGRVYRADNPRTGEVVAIKVLRKRWAEDKRKIELFEREGKVGLSMQHPNIVRILAVNRDPPTGQYYIVMEFVEGGNLRDFLAIRKKLEAPEALRLLDETASGLSYALERGLTHRDLKPTNILISSTRTAKLVDFGLAELAGGAREEGGEVDRTVDYAGLEKATGAKAGDPRSDIYFLGTVFFEMLTGRPLLTAVKDARARMDRRRFELGSQIQRDDPDLNPTTYALISRMVAFDPTGRFQTYEQLLEAIRDAGGSSRSSMSVIEKPAAPKTIYVVEQHQKLQDAFRDKLKRRGYRVLISINPSQALTRFQAQPYDGLIMDVGTAGRDGLEMLDRVINAARLKAFDLTAIAILSQDQAHWAEEIATDDRTFALVRPVTMRQILERVSETIPTAAPENSDEDAADGDS